MYFNPSEVHYSIYQTHKREIAFEDVEGNTVDLKEDEYKKVWEGKDFKLGTRDDIQILNDLYTLHNRDDRPSGKVCRSLSISDIVVVEGRAYACQRDGWKRIFLENEEED
jgi:hypothetical protein